MGRSPCCKKVGLNKGPWTEAEDAILSAYIKVHGEGNWRLLPKSAGLMRCGKSCRLRWINYLRPDLKRGNISPDEDELIIKLHSLLGNRWSLIAGRIPGRTDNEIKNYWNTHLKRKFGNMGVDPSNHRLFPTPTSSTPNSSSDDCTNGDNSRDPQRSTDFDQGADSHNRSSTTSLTPGRHSTDFDHGASLSNFNLSDYPLSQRDGSASEPGSRMYVQFYPGNVLEENCCRPPILEGISKEALEESQSHSPESVLSYADMNQLVESHADWSIGSREQLQPIEAHIPFFDCTEAASNCVDTHFPPEFHKDLTASPLWTSLSLFDNF